MWKTFLLGKFGKMPFGLLQPRNYTWRLEIEIIACPLYKFVSSRNSLQIGCQCQNQRRKLHLGKATFSSFTNVSRKIAAETKPSFRRKHFTSLDFKYKLKIIFLIKQYISTWLNRVTLCSYCKLLYCGLKCSWLLVIDLFFICVFIMLLTYWLIELIKTKWLNFLLFHFQTKNRVLAYHITKHFGLGQKKYVEQNQVLCPALNTHLVCTTFVHSRNSQIFLNENDFMLRISRERKRRI